MRAVDDPLVAGRIAEEAARAVRRERTVVRAMARLDAALEAEEPHALRDEGRNAHADEARATSSGAADRAADEPPVEIAAPAARPLPGPHACARAPIADGHRVPVGILLLALIAALVAWYADTAASLVRVWLHSQTYVHGLFVVPAAAWLAWRRRDALAAIEFRPAFAVLPLIALAGMVWLAGHLSETAVVQHYALVAMVALLVWTMLGTEAAKALAFPLAFLLLAVPAGDVLLPYLMNATADFTVAALRATGVPVYREGLFFMIPGGSWSVVEACSGLRYLIACFTVGLLYAYLQYRSTRRRVLFVAATLVVPVVANWLRAYLIVMIDYVIPGHMAAGIDHLLYGWIFFALVTLLLFRIGARWREDDAQAPQAVSRDDAHTSRRPRRAAFAAAALAAAVAAGAWPALATRFEQHGPLAAAVLHPPGAAGAWRPVATAATDWSPPFQQPDATLHRSYAAGTARAELAIAYYRAQRRGAELVTSANALLPAHGGTWKSTGESRRDVAVGDRALAVIEARLYSTESPARLLVWRCYRVGGRYTVNPYFVKFMQAQARLLGRADDAAAIVVYTPFDDNARNATATLSDFLAAMLPEITRSLDDAR